MPERARKPSQAAVDKRHRSHGKDGKTLAERIDEAMLLRDMDEAALVKRANEIAGEIEEGKPLVTQQSVNLIRKKDGGTKASRLVPILAEALDVRAVWLQWGIGERIDNRIAIPELIKSLTAARKG